MKLNKTQKQKIKKWVEEARTILGLQTSRILINFEKEGPDGLFADVDTSPVYQSGAIRVYENNISELWAEFGDEEVVQTIFHEVAHVFLCPVSDLGEKRFVNKDEYYSAVELLTEKVAYLTMRLRGK